MKKPYRCEKWEERQVMENEPQVISTSCPSLCLGCSDQAELQPVGLFPSFENENCSGVGASLCTAASKIQLLASDSGFDLRPDSREGGFCLTSLPSINFQAAPSLILHLSGSTPPVTHQPLTCPCVPVPSPCSPCPHHTPAGAHLPVWSYH